MQSLSDASFVLRVVVVTLAAILVSVVLTMLIGLFRPEVDNKEIFALIGPNFNTIVGGFVGVIGGLLIARHDNSLPPKGPTS